MLLHGLGLGHRLWQPQFEPLSEHFHVLAPDLPGFARSAAAGPFTISGAAEQVADLIGAQGRAPAHVCGLSLGALVAIQLGLSVPDRVASLILSAAQVRPPPALMWFQKLLFACVPEARLVEGIASDIPTRDESLLAAAREDARLTGKRGLLQAMGAAGRVDFRAELSRIHAPTLVLCGSRDWPNVGATRELARAIPGASLRLIPDAGHVWNIEQPELFVDTIREFVDQLH